MNSQKIIYSKWLMKVLVEKGFMPVGSMPNPNQERYTCWVFPLSDALEEAIQDAIDRKEANGND